MKLKKVSWCDELQQAIFYTKHVHVCVCMYLYMYKFNIKKKKKKKKRRNNPVFTNVINSEIIYVNILVWYNNILFYTPWSR
jgi:hypothetical protein